MFTQNKPDLFSKNYSITDYMVIASDSDNSFHKFCSMIDEDFNQYLIDEENSIMYLSNSCRPYVYSTLLEPRPQYPYTDRGDRKLTEAGVMIDLPYPLDNKTISGFIIGWLGSIKYPKPPMTDGICKPGYFMYYYHNVLIVKPYWQIYGK